MIKRSLLLLLFISTFQSFAHYAQSASFVFSKEKDKVVVNIAFAEEHLLDHFRQKSLTTEKIKQYVFDHFECKINNQKTNITFLKVNTVAHHVEIKIQLNNPVPDISSIYVWNTCLLEYHSEHINIIHFDLNGRYRSFKTDRHRNSIIAKYE